MNHYLIVYDKQDGEITYLRRYGDGQLALAERFALELEREDILRASDQREIVVLGADSLADLRQTHGRYFLTERELSELLTARLHANPRYREALRQAEAESWDGPGVSVEDMIAMAEERRRAVREGQV